MGETWTPETRAGSFALFMASVGDLSEEDFVARFPHRALLTTLSVERSAWDGAILLVLSKADGSEGEILLGRDDTCDVIITQAGISKKHAVFFHEGDAWFIEDLASSNGTKLDGTTLEREERVPLPAGHAVLDFGGVRLHHHTPATLYQHIAKAREAEKQAALAPKPKPAATTTSLKKKPDWNASHHAKTDAAIPIPKIDDVPARASGRLKNEDVPPFWRRQLFSIVGSPRRVVLTLVVIAAVIVSAKIYGRSLAFMIFGESHPEWFRE
ncbi:MAG TPA: FHA domain-containing protein [Planctomycetota bacterium]|nr:FHA domain-containing protein [Planctomycetota bacterium]